MLEPVEAPAPEVVDVPDLVAFLASEPVPPAAAGTAARAWAELDKAVYAYEHANPAHRITRIFFNGADAPEHYVGMNSECDIEHGAPAIRLSSGDIIEI